MNNNSKPSLDNEHLTSFLHYLIFQLSINTAHDYDGLETDDDIILYQNAVKEKIKILQQKSNTDDELADQVYREYLEELEEDDYLS